MILGLKEPDTHRQVEGHDPKLHIARIVAVEGIGHEDQEQVYVQNQKRGDGEPDVTHLENGVFTVGPDDGTHGIEDERIGSSKSNVGNTEPIPVVIVAPVMAIGVDVHHVRGGWNDAIKEVAVKVSPAGGSSQSRNCQKLPEHTSKGARTY